MTSYQPDTHPRTREILIVALMGHLATSREAAENAVRHYDNMVAIAEREACAAVADLYREGGSGGDGPRVDAAMRWVAEAIGADIRARYRAAQPSGNP